jgi:sugar lactone lactonase YvrE
MSAISAILLVVSLFFPSFGLWAQVADPITPRSIGIKSKGELLISDDVKFQVLQLESSGKLSLRVARGIIDPVSGRKIDIGRPVGLALDNKDNLYICDRNTHRVFKLDNKTGALTIVAGNRQFGYRYDDVKATEASLSTPVGIAIDKEGHILIVEQSSRRIRRVHSQTGIITTIAGSGKTGFSGDGGAATEAAFDVPFDIAVDRKGNLYIADTGNNRIRKVDRKTGIISTVAGNGKSGFSGDEGPAVSASLSSPFSITLDQNGSLYIADTGNHRVRFVDVKTGIISTIAGSGSDNFDGDGGPAKKASLSSPFDVTIDQGQDLYIADTGNNQIRKVNRKNGIITSVNVKLNAE